MRVTGGDLGGRRLRAPAGLSTRPTSDMVRQALFNILGAPPAGARVLDLYAGTGALGIEALSRGAGAALFVERDRAAARVLQANLAELGLQGRADLLQISVERALGAPLRTQGPFHWIFADPPYDDAELPALLSRLGGPAGAALLAEGAVVVVEHAAGGRGPRGAALADNYGALRVRDRRCYGQTALSFYGAEEPAPDPQDGPAGPGA